MPWLNSLLLSAAAASAAGLDVFGPCGARVPIFSFPFRAIRFDFPRKFVVALYRYDFISPKCIRYHYGGILYSNTRSLHIPDKYHPLSRIPPFLQLPKLSPNHTFSSETLHISFALESLKLDGGAKRQTPCKYHHVSAFSGVSPLPDNHQDLDCPYTPAATPLRAISLQLELYISSRYFGQRDVLVARVTPFFHEGSHSGRGINPISHCHQFGVLLYRVSLSRCTLPFVSLRVGSRQCGAMKRWFGAYFFVVKP